MATRNISTKLAISGESEYRAALKNINSELKVLQSNLKLTESQYQTNANSMQALSAKGESLRKVYEAQKKKVEELKSALDNAKKAEETYSKQKEELSKKINKHRKNILNSIRCQANSAKSEAANTTIKVLIKMARGFRNIGNLIALIYLKCSDLVIPLNNRPQMTPEQAAAARKAANEKRKIRQMAPVRAEDTEAIVSA